MKNKVRGLDQACLKLVAVICMTLNHISAVFHVTGITGAVMLIAGMVCMPLFSCFIADGFRYTHDYKRYAWRLALGALISHFAFQYAFGLGFPVTSAIYTLFLALASLRVIYGDWPAPIKNTAVIEIVMVSFLGDWGGCAVLWTLAFDAFREKQGKMLTTFIFFGVGYTFLMGVVFEFRWISLCFIMAIPLLLIYSKRQGILPHWMRLGVYAYYPVNLFVLGYIKRVLGHI